MTADVDLAIVGSGFGGSLLAMIAARLGLRTMLIERGRHPRFAIGESASPLAGVIIEQLADRYDLPGIRPLSAYGIWKRAHPDVVCGLKRGFTYFKHGTGQPYAIAPDRHNQLLVAASPCDELSDTHWLRSDVDCFLVREAIALGVEYVDQVALDRVEWSASDDVRVSGYRASHPFAVRASILVDASGPGGFLARALNLEAPGFPAYPATQALYSHFVDVARCADIPEFQTGETPPYPIDAAALHHVFDEGWMWVLRFDNGVTSAGVAVTDALAATLRLSEGEPAWHRLLKRYPSIAAQFGCARAIRQFTWMPRIAYRSPVVAGARWAMLPSAAAFVDPLFSTGMPLTLLGIERLAAWLHGGAARGGLTDYAEVTEAEADHTARFIAGCYAGFPRFRDFTAYSMFYFVAASFTEMARRLGQPTPGFLAAADRGFADAMAHLSPARVRGIDADVGDATAHLNVAGLCDPAKRNWYDVDVEDTVRAASKLGVSAEAVRAMLLAAMGAEGTRVEEAESR